MTDHSDAEAQPEDYFENGSEQRKLSRGIKRETGEDMAGKLWLCATPIGNLGDMTPRAVEALKNADLIAAEDTRNSIKLLNHFDIHTQMTSYHEYNKYDKGRELADRLLQGQTIVLITDAGMPGISDPGEVLTAMAVEAGVEVSVLPGASACLAALVLSGLPTRRFVFEAFLPSDKKERRQVLSELEKETRTIVLYEAPHRLTRTLAELRDTLGEDRRIALCRELTKLHETVQRMTVREALAYYETEAPRGEYVLVIEGRNADELQKEKEAACRETDLQEHMRRYEEQGLSRKEVMKLVARDRGVSRREIYALLEEKKHLSDN